MDYDKRAFRIPRIWSNRELAKFAGLYDGGVVNVSGWQDKDKEGRTYRSYFEKADRYDITNFGLGQGEMQGWGNEFFLDLEQPLPPERACAYDVVFNHTTLEHIWDFAAAWRNLAALSRDTVILVVPWIQPLHTTYGDYWRFSPQAVARRFRELGLTPVYLSWNDDPGCAVYVFCVATRRPEHWCAAVPLFRPDLDMDVSQALAGDFAGKRMFDART